MNSGFEEIEHTADWAIRVRGRDLRELFVNAARGMFGLIADVEAVTSTVEERVELDAYDTETLLVSWLGELLWLNETHDLIFTDYRIERLTPVHLRATVSGGPLPADRSEISSGGQWKQIKAVTFHDLAIVETDNGYEVTIVFDV